jgi:cytochrome c5
MKKGEKTALWFVLAGIIVIAVLTTYMEIQHRKSNPAQLVSRLANEGLKQTKVGLDTSMIPQALDPDSLPGSDSRGAALTVLYCTQCHELPTPLMHTSEEWTQIIVRMQERMQERRGGMLNRIMIPPRRDWLVIEDYLKSYAQHPLPPQGQNILASAGGQVFKNTCSQCHATPDPKQHSAQEWPRVVLRMKANMRHAHKEIPDSKTTQEIVAFLQDHSKTPE